MTDRPVYDVVIVGQGPVGATAACLLADEGLTVLALESQLTPYPLPRAARFDGETMRTFQRIGVAEEIARNTYVGGGGQFLSADGEHLGGWAYHPPTNGWENSYYFFQPELEEILNRRVAGHPGIEVRTGSTLVGYQQSANAVDVTVRVATGPAETFTARYLVGCDGARSTVRSAMGVAVEDLGYEERWVVVDVNLLEDAELPTITTQYCDPDRPATYVPGRGAHRRWEFMLAEGEDARTLERPDVIHAMLGRYVDPARVEIIRASLYTFHSLLGRDWRSGRVLLAGDAAHQTPPFLGQGMCSGIRDAQNLSWKLAAVVNGSAPDTLLDTYQAERAPHFRAIMERAIECGRIVGVFDHDVAEVRNKEFLRRMGEGDVPFSSYRVPSLAGGLIGPGSPAPAGGLSRQGFVEDQQGHRRLLDEVVGGGAVLLVAGEEWPASPADAVRLGAAADQAGVALCVVRSSQRQYPDQDLFGWHVVASDDAGLCAWVSAHRFILVRPDRYIQGVAGTAQAAAALLRQWSSVLANPEHIVGEPA